jgi:hypothetical protein
MESILLPTAVFFDIVLLLINTRQQEVYITFKKMATQLNRKQKNIECKYDCWKAM